ncbi:hypothetical protein IQ215_11200 [Cyanobacterium stanieri LEGE 03274]|uniref:Uncharacterized protein n=1 Tax=Cyanobacterium stanieri LEGE 03274 TaxID=1828756 RepID=A0ABR9V5U0_9CHRO|nr:hypothetical protein [Cyanobacterium stanieri]MBE9223263.1 hypothetical protein [Cyanobacterium stanieri LEGE 03274]
MVLKKILSKKKGQPKYFLEVEVKDQAPETPVAQSSEKEASNTPKQAQKSPAPSANTSNDQPDWVKAIKNYSTPNPDNGDGVISESETFAGKYISNNVPTPRRRPGGSLKPFKDIASQMNK